MNIQAIQQKSRFASQIELMKFYEYGGKLCFQGLFACEPYEKDELRGLVLWLNDQIREPLHEMVETLKREIRDEANK